MSGNAEQLRKAAILIAALDDAAADTLLERMSPEQAGLIRRTVVELRQIDDAETQTVLREFVVRGGWKTPAEDTGVELDLTRPATMSSGPAFHFLHEAAEEDLVDLLAAESPQVAAVVVSQLPADQAARALAALPEALQLDVMRRLARLDGADPAVLREVEAGLQQRYRRRFAFADRRVAGVNGVQQILQVATPEVRGRWLNDLSRNDPRLAAKLTQPTPAILFDDLDRLTDDSLRTVLEAVDRNVTVLALAGADLSISARVKQVLPRVHGAQLQREIDRLGSIRLSDVDAAQDQMAAEVARLESLGRLTWRDALGGESPSYRVAAAA